MMILQKEAADIMTTDLVTVTDDTPVNTMKSMFKSRGIHHLLVENNVGELLGIVSTEDLARTAHFPVAEEKLLARHIMTGSPLQVRVNTPLKQVVEYFVDNYFRAIPVINADNVLVGIVTPYDVMVTMLENQEV